MRAEGLHGDDSISRKLSPALFYGWEQFNFPNKLPNKPPMDRKTEIAIQRQQKWSALLNAVALQKFSFSKFLHGEYYMLFWQEFIVRKNERGLLFKQGDFQKFLSPGTYRFFDPLRDLTLQVFDLSHPEFKHPLTDFLLNTYPEDMANHFTVVELGMQQLALVYKNGHLVEILPPATRTLYWKGFVTITVEIIDISENFRIASDKFHALLHTSSPDLQQQVKTAVYYQEIPEYHRGLLSVDDQCEHVLMPGVHAYWQFNRKIAVEIHDLATPEFKHRLANFRLTDYPAEIARQLTQVELNAHQVALIYKNGTLTNMLPPSTRATYWKGVIDVVVEIIDISSDFSISADKFDALLHTQLPALQQQLKSAINYQEIPENYLGLLFVDKQCVRVLAAGLHAYWNFNRKINVEIYDLSKPQFNHELANFRLEDYPVEIADYFTQIELNARQVALIYENGVLSDILPPATRATYWKGKIDITAEFIDISENFAVSPDKAHILVHTQNNSLKNKVTVAIYSNEVPEHRVGLLYVEGQYVTMLKPGLHAYWKFNRDIVIKTVDTRLQEMEISGQEILTKDKVGLRINLSAIYVIKDVLKMVAALVEPADYLYKELQFGLRSAVGTRTLDELLENKTVIDEVVFAHVQKKVNEFGIHLQSVGVKDIILPGEMRAILSKVVEAEKTAQANIIRRREETAATRSLLNTAKVMEDNPTALRLKELETLEKVTEKIGSISVYGGLEGLLKELVKIRQ